MAAQSDPFKRRTLQTNKQVIKLTLQVSKRILANSSYLCFFVIFITLSRLKVTLLSGGHCRQMCEQVIKLTLQVSKIMLRILANSSCLSLMKLATETREI